MVNVQFEQPETTTFYAKKFVERERAGLTNWLINTGIVKDERTANFILIGVIIVLIIGSILLTIRSFGTQSQPLTEIQKKSTLMNRPHAQ